MTNIIKQLKQEKLKHESAINAIDILLSIYEHGQITSIKTEVVSTQKIEQPKAKRKSTKGYKKNLIPKSPQDLKTREQEVKYVLNQLGGKATQKQIMDNAAKLFPSIKKYMGRKNNYTISSTLHNLMNKKELVSNGKDNTQKNKPKIYQLI